MKNHGFILILLLGIIFSGCKKLDENKNHLDVQLNDALTEASGGAGKSYYILPESDDLSAIPQDPNNPITPAKVRLGRFLYHETALGLDAKHEEGINTYSCASCHHADCGFQSGLAQGIGDGGLGYGDHGEMRHMNENYNEDSVDVQSIRTPSALNAAFQRVMLWNGQFGAGGPNEGTEANWTEGTQKEKNHLGYEGIETQSIAGLEVHRQLIDTALIFNTEYRQLFDQAYPNLPETERYTKISAGLAIAAYERTLLATEAPFQKWLKGNHSALSEKQKKGALLFFGKANCFQCHNGPALNSESFHALGMKDLEGPGILGPGPDEAMKRGRGGFTNNPEDDYKFKTPQLYNLRYNSFFGHGASFGSVKEVLVYKNRAVKENPIVPEEQLSPAFKPLNLTDEEINQLADFINHGLDDKDLYRYEPSYLPSGNCFPNNDEQSKIDLGCNTKLLVRQ